MINEKFWQKSYDQGLSDLDPKMWETTYVEIASSSFKEFPDKPAFVFMDLETTFLQLDQFANQFANMLVSNGFKKGDVVGINLLNIPEYIIAWLGTLKAGCVVSGVSPLLSPQEMLYQLTDANVKGLVTLDAIFSSTVLDIISSLPQLNLIILTTMEGFLPGTKRVLDKLLAEIPKEKATSLKGREIYEFKDIIETQNFSKESTHIEITPDDIAYIQYTGGTTGAPKGTMLSHRNAVSNIIIMTTWLGWRRGKGVALSGFPFFHMAGLAFNKNCVYLGWKQILIPNPRDTDYICTQIAKYKPNALVNVPSLYQLLMANPKFRALDHSNLEICICAASPFPEDSQRELEEIIGKGKLLEAYGMTELTAVTTMNPLKGKKKLGTVGLPIFNTDMKLLDTDTGEEVPIGKPGEVCVKAPYVMVGYYNKSEETKNVIDPQGYMHSGDVAIQDEEGYLRIVDRTKDMIIVSGYKVFSKKVEEILAEHPAIEMVAYIGIKNPDRPGSEIVKAFVTLKPDFIFDGDEEELKKDIIQFAKEKLAPYEVPKTIEIKQELPITAVGKIDKKILRKQGHPQ
ncbi:MAG: AMP-binding protein [Thermodesulfobacteriota bacterium]|nr:AMP-binding protein [Thermodesulfobacteriota bacterium]